MPRYYDDPEKTPERAPIRQRMSNLGWQGAAGGGGAWGSGLGLPRYHDERPTRGMNLFGDFLRDPVGQTVRGIQHARAGWNSPFGRAARAAGSSVLAKWANKRKAVVEQKFNLRRRQAPVGTPVREERQPGGAMYMGSPGRLHGIGHKRPLKRNKGIRLKTLRGYKKRPTKRKHVRHKYKRY